MQAILRAALSRLLGRREYRREENQAVPSIRFLGLWDAVGAYGLPIEELRRAWERYVWPLPVPLPAHVLANTVQRACHALALDDERATFHPILWSEEKEAPAFPDAQGSSRTWDDRISQVWFAGVHADVGGGYEDNALSLVSLWWMMDEARKMGLRFAPQALMAIASSADSSGLMHDSRTGFGRYYRYSPRKVAELTHQRFSRADDGVSIDLPLIHESVLQRIKAGTDGYAPIGLPASYELVMRDGTKAALSKNQYETAHEAVIRARLQEQIWDRVWVGRALYAAIVFVTAYLILFPIFHAALPFGACASPFCFISDCLRPIVQPLRFAVASWIDSYLSNPGYFALGVGGLAFLFHFDKRIASSGREKMRGIWAGHVLDETIQKRMSSLFVIRTSYMYRTILNWLGRTAIPIMFIVTMIFGSIVLLSRGVFAVGSSIGLVCRQSESVGTLTSTAMFQFSISDPCFATGVQLVRGRSYRIRMEIADETEVRGYLATPFRRWLGEPWFKPIARIGAVGADEYPLDNFDGLGVDHPTLEARITARTSGELFFFVNDILPIPLMWSFYNNDKSTAVVWIDPITK